MIIHWEEPYTTEQAYMPKWNKADKAEESMYFMILFY